MKCNNVSKDSTSNVKNNIFFDIEDILKLLNNNNIIEYSQSYRIVPGDWIIYITYGDQLNLQYDIVEKNHNTNSSYNKFISANDLKIILLNSNDVFSLKYKKWLITYHKNIEKILTYLLYNK